MATIVDLHTSISLLSDDELYNHIRDIRSLRREIPIKPARGTVAKKKPKQKQLTIEQHLTTINADKRAELLKQLLLIRRKRND